MRGDSVHEVGKLINYFENFINDLNKDGPSQSKWKSNSETHLAHPAIRTTSENTSNLSITFNEAFPSILPTIPDEEIYDHLTYETLIQTDSSAMPVEVPPVVVVEPLTHSSKNSSKRRQQTTLHRKRLHRRRAPTYIKELKAYLAHRQSSVADLVKISDVKKFSHVLVWLANQRSSPDGNPPASNSITTESLLPMTQQSSQLDAEPILCDPTPTKSFSFLIYDQIKWKLKLRKEVFSPSETFDEPLLCDLLYRQILFDTFSSNCLRIRDDERRRMKRFFASHNVTSVDQLDRIAEISVKRTIVEKARRWSIYFSRLFPVSTSSTDSTQFLGISHSGIQLFDERRKDAIDVVSFHSIEEISPIKNELSIEIRCSNRTISIFSKRIRRIHAMLEEFLRDAASTLTEPSESVASQSPTNHSMMEFAVQNFQLPVRRSKKTKERSFSSFVADWTWQDYSSMIKWSKVPLQTSLLRRLSNRLARSSFLAIMRFMGDYPMARSQTDMDCLVYLLKTMQKHSELIDEVFCQLLKQLTENRSVQTESVERGWKLLVLLLNYFLPDERLRIYLLRFLYDHRNVNERLVQLASNHYDQTLKYGGRRVLPNRAEIDLLLAHGRNGGKRQTFLLPGGIPLTFLVSPSMVIADCLQMLCEKLEVPNKDEYSFFLIASPKSSSRLLDANEYLFDILNNDSVRSTRVDSHLIIKRTLWLNNDDDVEPSALLLDLMFYQLQADFSQGALLVLPDDPLPSTLMKDIARLVALQYRISKGTSLPTMKEIKQLLPTPILKYRTIRPQEWTNLVHEQCATDLQQLDIGQAKMQFLNLLETFPLFGTTIFPVQSVDLRTLPSSCLIGVSKRGVSYLDSTSHETFSTINYSELIAVRREQKTLELQAEQNTIRCQIDRAQDVVALLRRYLHFTPSFARVSFSTKIK